MDDPWHRFREMLAGEILPAALVDIDALRRNALSLLRVASEPSLPIRVATKSVRCVHLLQELRTILGDRYGGLMTYSARETAHLATQGFSDLLCAYPVSRLADAEALAQCVRPGVRAIAMVDHVGQIGLLAEAGAARGVDVPVCIDIDGSLRLPGNVHLGVRRSPVRDPVDAVALASRVAELSGVTFVGVMSYEAQVAGMPDVTPSSRWLDPVRGWVKRRSVRGVAARRGAAVEALRHAGHRPVLVNGGGTGSLVSTSADPTVSEVTVGSGFFCPALFDGYKALDLEPAAFFALQVARFPGPGFVTCSGGGYVASGAAGADRLPTVHLPQGLIPVGLEGFGEVQTPFRIQRPGLTFELGDPVICRHAKAGELMERFAEVLLVSGARVIERVATYRGDGLSFG